jgi:hypothetical protein
MLEIEERRKKEIEKFNEKNQKFITVHQNGKPPINLNTEQVIDLIKKQSNEISQLQKQIDSNNIFIKLLKDRIKEKDDIINKLYNDKNNIINDINNDKIYSDGENIKINITEKEKEKDNFDIE